MDKIAVLIPCYNESQTIEQVVRSFKAVLPDAVIYVYDNNSTDGTAEIARNAGAVVRKARLQGKGNVIRDMFKQIDAECYLMVDGDNQHPAEDAVKVIAPVLEKCADMVIGNRFSSAYFMENKRKLHNAGNRLVRGLVNHMFNSSVNDIMTGYRAFSCEFAKTLPILSGGFEVETEMTIFALENKMKLQEVLITYRDRPHGSSSKLNTFSDGMKVLKTIFFLYKDYKPMAFFSIISLFLALVGIAAFIPIIITFFETGQTPGFPTFIAPCFLLVSAIISFFSGAILDTLRKQHRQNFEHFSMMIHNDLNLLKMKTSEEKRRTE